MGRVRHFSAVVFCMIFGPAALCIAAPLPQVDLLPTADAFVSSANASSNYGAADRLHVSGAHGTGEFQTLLKFNVAPVKTQYDALYGPGQWLFNEADVSIFFTTKDNALYNDPAVGNFVFEWLPNDSWIEGTGTSSAPSATGVNYNSLGALTPGLAVLTGTRSYSGLISGGARHQIGMASNTGFWADLAAGGDVTIRLRATSAPMAMLFNSRESPNQESILTVVAYPIPEPSAGGVGIAAAAATTGMLLRRRSRGCWGATPVGRESTGGGWHDYSANISFPRA